MSDIIPKILYLKTVQFTHGGQLLGQQWPPDAKAIFTPYENLANQEYFLFFTTYPGCGATCVPFFNELNQLQSMMNSEGRHPFLIVVAPFEDSSESFRIFNNMVYVYHGYVQYYHSKKITYPWIRPQYRGYVKSLLNAVMGDVKNPVNLGNYLTTSCPRYTLMRAIGSKIYLIESMSCNSPNLRLPFIEKCKLAIRGVPFVQ